MPKKKQTRRVRGPDGKLHTKDEVQKVKTSTDSSGADSSTSTKVVTKNGSERANKASVQEKVRRDEKDNSPVILITYKDNSGRSVTKQFTCDRIEMTENRHKTFQRSGPQTKLDIYIEATVIDEM